MSKRLWVLVYIFYTALSVAASMLIAFYTANEASFGIKFLMGPANGYYSPLEIVWWLFLFTPVWAVCGWILDMSTKLSALEIYRYKRGAVWWLKLVLKVYAANLWYFFILYVILMVVIPASANIEVIIGLALHSLFITATMVWFYLCSGRVNAAFIAAIVAEALGKLPVIAGMSPQVNPFVWGMYGYCDKIWGFRGFSFKLSAGIQLVYILAVMIIPIAIKKIIMRGVCIGKK